MKPEDLIEQLHLAVTNKRPREKDNYVIFCHPDTKDRVEEILIKATKIHSKLEKFYGLSFYTSHFAQPNNFLVIKQTTAEIIEMSEMGWYGKPKTWQTSYGQFIAEPLDVPHMTFRAKKKK